MPPDQFVAYVAWPRDRFYFSEGGGDLANEAGPSTTIDDDFNTELDEFLRKED